jgi:hypothetical protein
MARPVSDSEWEQTLRDGGLLPRVPARARPASLHRWAWCGQCDRLVPVAEVRWWGSAMPAAVSQSPFGWSSEHAAPRLNTGATSGGVW